MVYYVHSDWNCFLFYYTTYHEAFYASVYINYLIENFLSIEAMNQTYVGLDKLRNWNSETAKARLVIQTISGNPIISFAVKMLMFCKERNYLNRLLVILKEKEWRMYYTFRMESSHFQRKNNLFLKNWEKDRTVFWCFNCIH